MKYRQAGPFAALCFCWCVQAVAASFDCTKASGYAEKEVCSDPILSVLDEKLAENYEYMRAANIGEEARKGLRATQTKWLALRNKCADKSCLLKAYTKRLDEICEYPVISGAHPSCTTSEEVKELAQSDSTAMRAKQVREERAAYAQKFPFYAVLSCVHGNSTMYVHACFSGSVDTEINLTQGSVQRVYKVHEIANNAVGRNEQDGLYIDLPSSHYLVAQNASDVLTLRLRIYDRASGKLLAQREAGSLYGVVSSRN